MGARGKYGESKRDGEVVLEGNGRAAKGEEESEIEEGMRSKFLLFGEGIFCICLFLSCGGETGNPILFDLDGREASQRNVC
jgi:hypothetical protein